MDAGPLQTYTVEHALCGSAKHGHLGGIEEAPPPHLHTDALFLPIYPLSCSLTLTVPSVIHLHFTLTASMTTESLLNMVQSIKDLTRESVFL